MDFNSGAIGGKPSALEDMMTARIQYSRQDGVKINKIWSRCGLELKKDASGSWRTTEKLELEYDKV
jgi:hypothetical protein